jgi:hypothetical protein
VTDKERAGLTELQREMAYMGQSRDPRLAAYANCWAKQLQAILNEQFLTELPMHNEACATCGIPRDVHRNQTDPVVETLNSVWGDLNRCRDFKRSKRAAY